MDKSTEEPLVYSVEQARELLNISRGLMYEAIRSGQIPSLRIGRRILIPRSGLECLIESRSNHEENHRKP